MRCVTNDAEQKEQSVWTATRTSLPGLPVRERGAGEHVQSDALDTKVKNRRVKSTVRGGSMVVSSATGWSGE